MDYQQIYDAFIKDRRRAGSPAGYLEKHHIVPRSLGGSNARENLIALSARDHYFAHCCLARIHGGGMWKALHLMGQTQKQHGALRLSKGRMFDIARRESAKARSEDMSIGWLLGDVKGRKHYGPPSAETRARVSASLQGRKMSPEAIAKRTAKMQLAAPRFVFVEASTGRGFEGTALEFRHHTGIGQSHVSLLVSGRVGVAKGWVLAGNETAPRGNRDRTIRVFRHKDGRVFEGTAYDFNKAHIGDSGMLSNCINGKNGVKSARGWVYAGKKEPG